MAFVQITDTEHAVTTQPLVPAKDEARPRKSAHKRALPRILKWTVVSLLALAVLVGIAVVFKPKPIAVDVVNVSRGRLVVSVQESGVTRVKDRYLVSSPVTGNLLRIELDPNDPIKEGQALAQIAPSLSPLLDERTRAEAEARLAAARSALLQSRASARRAESANELARREVERARTLGSSAAISPETLEHAEFEARMRADELASAVFAEKVAAEEVRRAQSILMKEGVSRRERHIDVLAPVSGRVLRVHHESAGVVQAGSALLEIGDPEALEVVVDLLTTDAVNVRPGALAIIEGWGGERALRGRVRRVELAAFTRPSALGVDEQRANVIIVLTDPHELWNTLGDEYRVEVTLVIWEGENVIKVPEGALFRQGDTWSVFRVESDAARLTPVRLGHRGESEVEIASGLDVGTPVIVHPGDRVKDGVTVEKR